MSSILDAMADHEWGAGHAPSINWGLGVAVPETLTETVRVAMDENSKLQKLQKLKYALFHCGFIELKEF